MSTHQTPPAGYRQGVGLMLIGPDARVLVGDRIDASGPAWQMPQGGIDPGETPVQAAFREMKEEIGTNKAEILAISENWHCYDLPPALARHVWDGRYRGQTQKWFALRFTGGDADIDIATEDQEFRAWKWLAPDRLVAVAVPFKRDLYRCLVAEFRPWLSAS